MLKLKTIIFFFFFSYLGITQNSKNPIDSLGDNRIALKPIILREVTSGFLSFDVREVQNEFEKCFPPNSEDYGGLINYCGDIVGGIKNLLQTNIYSTPHIRFLNNPLKNRNVYFYSYGYDMLWGKPIDLIENKGNNNKIENFFNTDIKKIDVRSIILNIMSKNFNFEVQLIDDTLTVFALKIVDEYKLSKAQITYNEFQNGQFQYADSLKHPPFLIVRHNMQNFAYFIEQKTNSYTYDETRAENNKYFHIEIPKDIFDNIENYSKIKSYLEEYYGLTLIKSKKLEKVYEIKFND